jgi:hypothetical protein
MLHAGANKHNSIGYNCISHGITQHFKHCIHCISHWYKHWWITLYTLYKPWMHPAFCTSSTHLQQNNFLHCTSKQLHAPLQPVLQAKCTNLGLYNLIHNLYSNHRHTDDQMMLSGFVHVKWCAADEVTGWEQAIAVAEDAVEEGHTRRARSVATQGERPHTNQSPLLQFLQDQNND